MVRALKAEDSDKGINHHRRQAAESSGQVVTGLVMETSTSWDGSFVARAPLDGGQGCLILSLIFADLLGSSHFIAYILPVPWRLPFPISQFQFLLRFRTVVCTNVPTVRLLLIDV